MTGYTVDAAEKEEVDELLPQQAPRPAVESMPKLKTVNETHRRREWAHEINVNQPFDNFHDLVPEMAKEVMWINHHVMALTNSLCSTSFHSNLIHSRSMPYIIWKWVILSLSLLIPRLVKRLWRIMLLP